MNAPSGSATGTVDMVGGPLDDLVSALYAWHNYPQENHSLEVVHAAERAITTGYWLGYGGISDSELGAAVAQQLTAEDIWHAIVEIGTNV